MVERNADEADGKDYSSGRGLRLLWRYLPLIVGLIAFELTSNSMLGIVVGCLKFGWEDFFTAVWILRADRNRTRGASLRGFPSGLGLRESMCHGIGGCLYGTCFGRMVGRKAQSCSVGPAGCRVSLYDSRGRCLLCADHESRDHFGNPWAGADLGRLGNPSGSEKTRVAAPNPPIL